MWNFKVDISNIWAWQCHVASTVTHKALVLHLDNTSFRRAQHSYWHTPVYQAEADGHLLKLLNMVKGLPCCQYCSQNCIGNTNVLVVVLKQCSALCNGSCHDSQCVKHTSVITQQYNGASHLQNYSSCNTGWWSNLKHSYLLPQSYTELLDLTKRNTMWNNPISSHRTEHDIWSFTVSVHPICILRGT